MRAFGERAEADILTFHTNGEDPAWVHDWETTSTLLQQGRPFHTTQLGLIDSHAVRYGYDRFRIVDGPNEFLFTSDGKQWLTDWLDAPVRKICRILHMWESGKLDGDGSRIKPWDSSFRQRMQAMQAQGDRIQGEGFPRRVVTFHVGRKGHADIHGWLSAQVLIGMGLPFSTTQMSLLNDWQIKEGYDEIRIVEDSGRTTVIESDGRTWRSDATQREMRLMNNLFNLWKVGEFA